jgi:uncharacterized protein YutE (UPF0331/DUF86 family)
VVDGRRLAGILRRVTDDVAALRGYGGQPRDQLRSNPAALGHVKYLFITAIEGCIDAAHHVLASEGWAMPDSNAEAMRALAKHGLLTEPQGEAMARAVGFRNILVHGYRVVDEAIVLDSLDRLQIFDAFAAALAGLIQP